MTSALPDFLARIDSSASQREEWPGASLHVEAYLSSEVPPIEYVYSARCIVLRDRHVLLQTDVTREHIIPGGRLEKGESPETAMRREVIEETGWTLGTATCLGFLHFRHLEEVPPDYPHPYPEFLQVAYTAQAREYLPHLKLDDEHEQGTRFLHSRKAIELPLTRCEAVFLEAALS